jgi:hypothetical protein
MTHRLTRSAVALLGVTAAILLVPGEAEACRCKGGVRAVAPAPDSIEVPLNAEIRLLWNGASPNLVVVRDGQRVQSAVDEVVDRRVRYVRARPTQLLAQHTEYIVGTYAGELEDGGVGYHEVTRFRTGDQEDHLAPAAPRVKRVSHFSEPGWGSSCEGSDGYRVTVVPADEEASVFIHVYDDGPEGALRTGFQAGEAWLGEFLCNDTLTLGPMSRAGLRLRSVDLAGNESAEAEPLLLSPCGCGTGGGALGVAWAAALLGVGRRRRAVPDRRTSVN